MAQSIFFSCLDAEITIGNRNTNLLCGQCSIIPALATHVVKAVGLRYNYLLARIAVLVFLFIVPVEEVFSQVPDHTQRFNPDSIKITRVRKAPGQKRFGRAALKLGQKVNVKVMELDIARKRIALSIKQTEMRPAVKSQPAKAKELSVDDALSALKKKFAK
jgi:hypothetical protein